MKKIKDTLLEKELDLYKKYYEVDDENKLICFTLRFDSASELVEKEISTKEKPLIKYEILEMISEKIRSLPETYRADVKLDIKDLEGYTNESLMEAIKDSIEFSHYRSDKQVKKNWVLASIFILVGLVILLTAAFLASSAEEWVSTTNGSVFKEILDIAAWVFIWEAVSILFISPTEESIVENSLRIRLHSLTISSKKEGEDAIEEDSSYLLSDHHWNKSKIKRSGKYILLVSGFLMIATSIATVFFFVSGIRPSLESIFATGNNGTTTIDGKEVNNAVLITTFIFALIVWLGLLTLRVLGGLAAVSRFVGRGKLQKFVGPYAITMLALYTIFFVAIATMGSGLGEDFIGTIFSSTLSIILNVAYLTGYFLDRMGQ